MGQSSRHRAKKCGRVLSSVRGEIQGTRQFTNIRSIDKLAVLTPVAAVV